MASRNQSETPLLAKFENKIAAEAKKKEDRDDAQKKDAAKKRRTVEIRDHSALECEANNISTEEANDISTEEAERFYRSPVPPRSGNKTNVSELESPYVLRRQPKSHSTPPTSPTKLASRQKPETEEFNSRMDDEIIAKLKSTLEAQQSQIRKLEKDLDATKDEVNRLIVERDEARKHHREAVQSGQQNEISRLKLEVAGLNQLLEEAEENEKRLSATAREEMDRALKTQKQLIDARSECLETLENTRTASNREKCHREAKDEQNASVTSGRRLSSGTSKRDSEYAFVRRKRDKNKILPPFLLKKISP